MTKQEAYRRMLEFVEAFVDYQLQTPEDYVADDGEPTTAAEMEECLKMLPKRLPQSKASAKAPVKETPKMSYEEWLNNPDFKDYIFTIRKDARESINPNYRYCVTNDNVDECYLTDDVGVAMEFAANKSKDGSNWTICKIAKAGDSSYRTYVEGYCMNGHYMDGDGRCSLHFDYIAQRCEDNIKKI